MIKIIQPILAILLFSPVMLHAQNPVPNPGFENWTAGNPDDWTANNFGPGASPVLQESVPFNGTYAARGEVVLVGPIPFFPILSSTDASAAGFPVSQQYATFSFYYKTNLSGSSFFAAFVGINDAAAATIGAGGMTFTGVTSSYTQATIPIVYTGGTPAEGVIGFIIDDSLAVPATGSYFIVDDVELSGLVGMEEKTILRTGIEKIQPNPAGNVSSVYYSLSTRADIQFELFDLTGRKHGELQMRNETAGRHKVDWELSQVQAGCYMLRMITPSGVQVAPFVIIH